MLLETAPMVQMRLIVLRGHERAVLERLGELGVVQLSRAPAAHAALFSRQFPDQRVHWADLAARAAKLRQSLPAPAAQGAAVDSTLSPDESLQGLEQRAAALGDEQRRLREQLEACERRAADRALYGGAVEALSFAQGAVSLRFVLGTVPADRVADLVTPNAMLLPLGIHAGRQALLAITPDRQADATQAALLEMGFVPAPAGLLDKLRDPDEGARLLERLAQVESERAALSVESASLLTAIGQHAEHEAGLCAAREDLQRTEATVLLTGWLAAAEAPALRAQIAALTGGQYDLEFANPAEVEVIDEQVPVLLSHARLLQPFAALIRAYGLPRYGELAPTLFVALTYVLMFGMMFGDVGHGLVLIGVGVLLLRRPRLHDAGVLVCFGGISSALFGALYGSYFGLEMARPWALWRDPLQGNPNTLMLVAVGQGVVLISLGIILNIANRLRRKQVWHAFADSFGISGLIFYWGVLSVALGYQPLAGRGIVGPLVLVVVGMPLVVWLVREPLAQMRRPHPGTGLVATCISSAVETFETVLVYLANTISFVRLAAYAMSHAALLLAITTLAHEIGRVPAVGGALAVLVLVTGNLGVMVLEGVIAAVQALRLEYYEFFGKFFSGSGQPFTPFRLQRCGVPWNVDWDANAHRKTREVAP